MDVVDTLPPQENADASAGGLGLVELARFANVSEAEMIRELLEKNDIGTVLRGEVDPIGSASGAEPTTLLVEERDLPRAQALYEAYFAGDAIQGALNEPE
jgi:hypothetical protein